MAHSSKSSLISRLFPQEDPPTSSGDPSSSSTLFARLSSPGLLSAAKAPFVASSSSRDEQLRPNDLYRACFATFSNDAAESRAQEDKAAEGDALAQLREAFAQEGVELHASVIDKLSEAQQNMASMISDFSKLSSSVASDIDELYANLSYPLSTTLCHSNTFPRATIEAHLLAVKEQLKKAESELRELEIEWQANKLMEESLRQELIGMETNCGHKDANYSKVASVKEEIERVVGDCVQALDDIEDAYKEDVQAQTMKMMQAMVVD
ncbi:flavo [Trichoderma arundinaceum]|uniref:Flavo n=1 Tax=Trichoderma arundinaceum TaxID=490622 RepID=A0A395NRS7_TRIAR|nr:flavo [Trichoderma arundinaceum]